MAGMTHAINVFSQFHLFVVTTDGEGTPKGICAFLTDIVSHPEWSPGTSVLLDHRKLGIDTITPAGVNTVSRFFTTIASELGDGKLALVMARDIDFGIARAWEAITSDYTNMDIFVFRKMVEALDWLEVDDSVVSN